MDSNATQLTSMIDMGVLRGLITALTMVVFMGIAWWAYHSGNRERFEQDALMVFTDDEMKAQVPSRTPRHRELGRSEA